MKQILKEFWEEIKEGIKFEAATIAFALGVGFAFLLFGAFLLFL